MKVYKWVIEKYKLLLYKFPYPLIKGEINAKRFLLSQFSGSFHFIRKEKLSFIEYKEKKAIIVG